MKKELLKKQLLKKLMIPVITILFVSIMTSSYILTGIATLVLLDMLFALMRKEQTRKEIFENFARNLIEVKKFKLNNSQICLPFFGYIILCKAKSEKYVDEVLNRGLHYYSQACSIGFLTWYLIYVFEYTCHFVVLLLYFRDWYYESYQPDMSSSSRKIKTLIRRANDNVCFNEAIDNTIWGTSEWYKYLFNETHY